MSNLKRKRTEQNDSDDEEPSFGRQILPVANLPENYNGIPSDGLEYLFTVRRDARQLPRVTFVPNPYERPEPILPPLRNLNATHPSLPSAEWCSLFESRFRNFRLNIIQPTIHVDIPPSKEKRNVLMPEKQDRAAWWEFLAGKPETAWSALKLKSSKPKKLGRGMRAFNDDSTTLDYGQPSVVPPAVHEAQDVHCESMESGSLPSSASLDPPLGTKSSEKLPLYRHLSPTPSLLRHIDERMSLHLLMYFTYWINLHLEDKSATPFPRLKQAHAQWIFALLARVEDHISADDMSLLRNLCRACLALLKAIICEKLSVEESLQLSEARDGDACIDPTSCWMIIRVVVGIWGQRDLWIDAEDMLRSIES